MLKTWFCVVKKREQTCFLTVISFTEISLLRDNANPIQMYRYKQLSENAEPVIKKAERLTCALFYYSLCADGVLWYQLITKTQE